MTADRTSLAPAHADGDAFLDALVGLHRVCRVLALVSDGATLAAMPAVSGDAAQAASQPDALLDAVLGLVSVRTTLALVLGALGGERADAELDVGPDVGPGLESDAAAAWSRELLR